MKKLPHVQSKRSGFKYASTCEFAHPGGDPKEPKGKALSLLPIQVAIRRIQIRKHLRICHCGRSNRKALSDLPKKVAARNGDGVKKLHNENVPTSNIPGIQGHLRWPNSQVLANLVASGSPCTNKNASACVFGCFRSPCAGKFASACEFGFFRSPCAGKNASACVFAPPSSRLEATKSESTFRFAHPSRRLEGTKNESTFVFAQPSPD